MSEVAGIDKNPLQALGLKQATRKPRNELEQEDFLKLMVAQLKNQNPTEPQDSADFMGQMAQFSTLDSISNVSKALMALSENMQGNKTLEAATLVGKSVGVETDKGVLMNNHSIQGSINLDTGVQDLTLQIKNQSGELLRSMSLGSVPSGQIDFAWDGQLENGEQSQDGLYSISAIAMKGGRSQSIPVQINSLVESVVVNDGKDIQLNLAGVGLKSLNEVKSVSTF